MTVIWGSEFTTGSNWAFTDAFPARRKNQLYTASNLIPKRFKMWVSASGSGPEVKATLWIMDANTKESVLQAVIVCPANAAAGYYYSDPLPDTPISGDFYLAFEQGPGATAITTLRVASTGAYITSTAAEFPSPFIDDAAYNYDFPVSLELEEGDTGPSINPTGTDTNLIIGETHSIAFAGITFNPVSIAIVNGETVTVQSDFILGAITDGAATATFTGTVGDLPYGASGYSYRVTCADESEITFDIDSLSPAAGRDYVVAVDPVNDETGILYVWDEGGPVTGDQISWPVLVDGVTTTIRPDFTFYGETETTFPDSITLDIDYWDSVTSTRYYRSVEVAFGEDGEGTVIGFSSRGFTEVGFTVRGFTSRGF